MKNLFMKERMYIHSFTKYPVDFPILATATGSRNSEITKTGKGPCSHRV